jgi:plasmid stability protein
MRKATMVMPTLVIRDLSPEVHRLLKQQAKEHHRSMNSEVKIILEECVASSGRTLPPLVRGAFPVTHDWLDEARRAGRE